MERTHDQATHALYVKVSNAEIDRTVEFSTRVLMDLAADGSAVGLEVLDADSPDATLRDVELALQTYGFPDGTRELIRG